MNFEGSSRLGHVAVGGMNRVENQTDFGFAEGGLVTAGGKLRRGALREGFG